jgi:hypothetical protein
MIWSLTSPRVRRISGSEIFRSPPQRDFCSNIRHKRSFRARYKSTGLASIRRWITACARDNKDLGSVAGKTWSGVTLKWDYRSVQSVLHGAGFSRWETQVPVKIVKPRKTDLEIECPACGDTGFPRIIERTKVGRSLAIRCAQLLRRIVSPRANASTRSNSKRAHNFCAAA